MRGPRGRAAARATRVLAVEAYARGSEGHPDPYPTINYFEERGVLEPTQPYVRSELEHGRLVSALHLRWAAHARQQDAPWPAFDLARGRYYLTSNARDLYEDLRAAVHEAKKTAPHEIAVAAVSTTRESFARLAAAGRADAGVLSSAALLLQALLQPVEWTAASAFRLYVPELRDRSWKTQMERLHADFEVNAARTWSALELLVLRENATLAAEDDAKLRTLAASMDPLQVKVARWVWKNAGPDAAEELCAASGVPGAALVGRVLGMVVASLTKDP